MNTKSYTVKNARIVDAQLDPTFCAGEDEFNYRILFEVSEQEASDVIALQKEVSKEQFGKSTPVKRMDKVNGVWRIAANSSDKPKISGVPNPTSRGLKLNLITQADITIEIWPYANNFGKSVGIELKELIFNHQPQPTGEQKCL